MVVFFCDFRRPYQIMKIHVVGEVDKVRGFWLYIELHVATECVSKEF